MGKILEHFIYLCGIATEVRALQARMQQTSLGTTFYNTNATNTVLVNNF